MELAWRELHLELQVSHYPLKLIPFELSLSAAAAVVDSAETAAVVVLEQFSIRPLEFR
jgi:hypothetical protein